MQIERILGGLNPEIRFSPKITNDQEILTTPEVPINQLDAIVIMGASIDYHPSLRRWRFPLIVQNGLGKVDGGNMRMLAALQLVKEGYTKQFLITGGAVESPYEGKASQAEEMASQMIEKRNIPREQVISLGRPESTNTHGNVTDIIEYLRSHPDVLQQKKIGILAGDWHMLRTLIIFQENPFFQEHEIELVPLMASKVLSRRSSHHAAWAEAINDIPEMENRVELEISGVTDLVKGTYKLRH